MNTEDEEFLAKLCQQDDARQNHAARAAADETERQRQHIHAQIDKIDPAMHDWLASMQQAFGEELKPHFIQVGDETFGRSTDDTPPPRKAVPNPRQAAQRYPATPRSTAATTNPTPKPPPAAATRPQPEPKKPSSPPAYDHGWL